MSAAKAPTAIVRMSYITSERIHKVRKKAPALRTDDLRFFKPRLERCCKRPDAPVASHADARQFEPCFRRYDVRSVGGDRQVDACVLHQREGGAIEASRWITVRADRGVQAPAQHCDGVVDLICLL